MGLVGPSNCDSLTRKAGRPPWRATSLRKDCRRVAGSAARKELWVDRDDGALARPAGPLSKDDIRAQLQKILASPDFEASPRLERFLSHVVEQTLAGNFNQLKGYAIAIDVFERDTTFDMMNDPVVRIEAGRLRRALERYYLLEGRRDVVLIEIPKGGYVGRFSQKAGARASPEVPAEPAARHRAVARSPTHLSFVVLAMTLVIGGAVALLDVAMSSTPASHSTGRSTGVSLTLKPFAAISSNAEVFAAGLSEEIVASVAQLKGVAIYRQAETLSSQGAVEGEQAPKQRLALEGSVTGFSDGRLLIRWRLQDDDTGAVIRAASQVTDRPPEQSFESQARVANKVVADIAQPLFALAGMAGPYDWEKY